MTACTRRERRSCCVPAGTEDPIELKLVSCFALQRDISHEA